MGEATTVTRKPSGFGLFVGYPGKGPHGTTRVERLGTDMWPSLVELNFTLVQELAGQVDRTAFVYAAPFTDNDDGYVFSDTDPTVTYEHDGSAWRPGHGHGGMPVEFLAK